MSYAFCASRKALNSALALIRRGVMHSDDGHDTAVAIENLTCLCDADDALGDKSCRDDADFFRIPLALGPLSNTNAILMGASASSAQLLLATSSTKSASCAVAAATCGGNGRELHDPHLNRSNEATHDTLLYRLALNCCLCMLAAVATPAAGFFSVKPGMNKHSAPQVKLSSAASGSMSTCSSCGAMDLPSARDMLRESTGPVDSAAT